MPCLTGPHAFSFLIICFPIRYNIFLRFIGAFFHTISSLLFNHWAAGSIVAITRRQAGRRHQTKQQTAIRKSQQHIGSAIEHFCVYWSNHNAVKMILSMIFNFFYFSFRFFVDLQESGEREKSICRNESILCQNELRGLLAAEPGQTGRWWNGRGKVNYNFSGGHSKRSFPQRRSNEGGPLDTKWLICAEQLKQCSAKCGVRRGRWRAKGRRTRTY